MNEQFSPEEILAIEVFCANEKMYNAVKKGVLVGIYSHGVIKAGHEHDPLQNGALSLAALSTNNPIPDEQLGQHIRGMWQGLNALENAYKGLKKITSKKETEDVELPNEAI